MLVKTDADAGAKIDALWLPGLDGLRALAVLAVLAHHSNGAWFTEWALGNVGVSVFYSISGFLAYYVLWKDERRFGAVDYNYFLTRRILRIWPAYFVIVGIASLWAYVSYPDQFRSANLSSVFFFTSNWHLAAGADMPLSTLRIVWSIAVEEQFYVLAPFMFLALRSRHWLAFSVAIILLANAGRAFYMLNLGPATLGGLYYVTYSYADVLLGGALAARWFTLGGTFSRKTQRATFLFASILIVAALRLWGPIVFPPYDPWTLLPYPMLALGGGLLVATVVVSRQTVYSALLDSAPMRFIGKLSYSLYLVHVLIITFVLDDLHLKFMSFWCDFWFITLCVTSAMILYRTIELPALELKSRLAPTAFRWAAVLTWSLLLIGLVRASIIL
jgi:peptidoglycan/LPS O-acetylase OafA/YrhL